MQQTVMHCVLLSLSIMAFIKVLIKGFQVVADRDNGFNELKFSLSI